MENTFQPAQPAFAPQRPMIPTGGAIRPPKRKSMIMLIASLIFIVAVAATGGLFFYKHYLTSENGAKAKKIQDAVNEVKTSQPELTKQLTLLKARIDIAKTLLGTHTAFTAFLALLEKNTVTTVQYTDFKYDAPSPDKISLTMKGRASNYVTIAYQSDVLGKNENLNSVIFSELALAESGFIDFNVKAGINPKVVSYSAQVLAKPTSATSPETGDVLDEETDELTNAMTAPAATSTSTPQ